MTSINAITNSGRKVSIVPCGVQENGNYKVTLYIDGLDGQHPYSYVGDGYIHLDADVDYTQKEIEAIKEINLYHFASKIDILTDIKEIENISVIERKKTTSELAKEYFHMLRDAFLQPKDLFSSLFNQPTKWRFKLNFKAFSKKIQKYQYKSIESLVPMRSIHIGGTFQKFYEDQSWLSDAENLKGKKIYLA